MTRGIVLKSEQIEKMFDLYARGENIHSISKLCAISRNTVKKYCDKGNWPERMKNIVKRTESKLNDEYAKRQTRHINIAKVLQQAGFNKFIDPDTGKLRKKLDLKNRDAITALIQGVQLEREILGDTSEQHYGDITINIQMVQVGTESPKTRGVDSKIIDEA